MSWDSFVVKSHNLDHYSIMGKMAMCTVVSDMMSLVSSDLPLQSYLKFIQLVGLGGGGTKI